MNSDDGTVRSVEAHEHGAAELAVVLEGSEVTVELESPVYNLTGFEYDPRTDAERDTVERVEAKLASPGDWLMFNAEAGCEAMPVSDVAGIFAEDDESGSHDDDHSHDNDHDDDHSHDDADHSHDDDHDDDHGDDHSHGNEAHSDHADYLIRYAFSCANPSELREVTFAAFNGFPNMEEIDGVYLGPDTQNSFVLTPSRNEAALRP